MIIESSIAGIINFFHQNALTSMVGLKLDYDLQITGSHYHLISKNIDRGYARCTAKTLFATFDLPGMIIIEENAIHVRFACKVHTPHFLAVGFTDEQVQVSWLGNKYLLVFD